MTTASSLFEDSEGFEKPALGKDAFDSALCSTDEVLSAFRALAGQEPYGTGIRVFEDGGMVADGQKRLQDNPPAEGEDVADWAKRLFGDKKFGLVLNSAERYNDALTAKIAKWFEDVFQVSGFPLGGLEMVFFVGNYGYTPFGVHLDRDQATVFHFNLGPGHKIGHVWPKDDYVALTGSTDFHFQPEEIVEHSIAHEFGPGDIYAMPSQTYHIARCDELTVDIAVALVRLSKHQLADKLVSAFRDDVLKTIDEAAIPPVFDWQADLPQEFTDIESSLSTETLDAPQYAQEYLLRLRSNGGFNAPPRVLEIDRNTMSGGSLQGAAPFQMMLHEQGQRALLFARGYKLSLVVSPALSDLVSRLNAGEAMTFDEALNLLSADYEPAAAHALLCRLVQLRALIWSPA